MQRSLVDSDDLTIAVIAAAGAHAVRELYGATLRAHRTCGHSKLAVSGATTVSGTAALLLLRYCHDEPLPIYRSTHVGDVCTDTVCNYTTHRGAVYTKPNILGFYPQAFTTFAQLGTSESLIAANWVLAAVAFFLDSVHSAGIGLCGCLIGGLLAFYLCNSLLGHILF